MKLIFISLLFTTQVLFSSEIQYKKGVSYLVDKDYQIYEKISAADKKLTPKPVLKELDDDFLLYTYLVNISGTKDIISTYNCSLFSKKKAIFIFKDNLCKSINLKKNETTEARIQIELNQIIYQYEELFEKYPLK